MKIYLDRHTFPEPTWICFDRCWMYNAPTFWGLLLAIAVEWRKDRNLIG